MVVWTFCFFSDTCASQEASQPYMKLVCFARSPDAVFLRPSPTRRSCLFTRSCSSNMSSEPDLPGIIQLGYDT